MTSSLFLTPNPPLPATQGAPMRNLTMIRAAATRGPVDLITFGGFEAITDAMTSDELTRLCRRFTFIPTPRRTTAQRAKTLARSHLPDMAHRLWSDDFHATYRRWVAKHDYDLIQVEGIEMARFALADAPERKIIFDDHNVEFLLQQRAFEFDRWRITRIHAAAYSALQARRLRRFEREVCLHAQAVVTVSAEDAARLRALGPCDPQIIPNAIDIDSYPFQGDRADHSATLLFPGTMDFRPNADAALWFIDQVLPRLMAITPQVLCYFAGRNPSPTLIKHGQHNHRIAVTGEVPSMAPYWNRAAVCILPLQGGGGTRFKALEAMAYGVPIISTGLGMEGIEALAGRDYLRADDPASFAEAVAHLLQNPSLQSALSANGRRVVERGYTQAVVTERLGKLYQRLCA
ncbi:MAG: glycosyltransferase family 4 protein [Chloroflexota bacterium]